MLVSCLEYCAAGIKGADQPSSQHLIIPTVLSSNYCINVLVISISCLPDATVRYTDECVASVMFIFTNLTAPRISLRQISGHVSEEFSRFD